ncbi:MAG TPA: cellulose binding domain-containing protein [Natronosporangium sp.]
MAAAVLPAQPASADPSPTDCEVTYLLAAEWPNGFSGMVTLRNLSDATTSGWEVILLFPNGQTVRRPWDPIGIPPMPGDPVVIRNAPWNGALPPGGSLSFGLLGQHDGVNHPPAINCQLFF